MGIVAGSAPSTTAILRFNQRAATVLSYVSQFVFPSKATYDIQAREHTAIHRVLRFPPNSMSRELMHLNGFCTTVRPVVLKDYCQSCMYRFALSEKTYLMNLAKEIRLLCGDTIVLTEVSKRVP